MTAASLADILGALDPEQHAVATAPAGRCASWPAPAPARPGRSPTGSPRSCVSGQVDPREVLALTFTARAAGELRGRLRALGVDGVQARTFHAAALRQLRYFWPPVVGGAPPNVLPTKAPLISEAASRLRVRADAHRDPRHRRRDRVGQGLADHAGGLPRGAAGRRRAAASAISTPRWSPASTPGTRRSSATAGHRLRGCPAAHRRHDRGRRRHGGGGPRPVPVHCSLTSTRTSARCSSACSTSGSAGRDDLTVVGDAEPDDLLLRRRDPALSARFSPPVPRADGDPARRNYRSTPQVVATANRLLDAVAGDRPRYRVVLMAQRPAGPEPQWLVAADEAGRGRCRGRSRSGRWSMPASTGARSRSCSGSTPRARPTKRR